MADEPLWLRDAETAGEPAHVTQRVGTGDQDPLPMPRIGQRVGHCRLISHLSRGGMGDVYCAEHLHLGRQVAIKVPRTDQEDLFFNQQRLLSEARHLARVSHVNVVSVYDLGFTSDGLAYLVMELLGGYPLDRVMSRTPRFSLPEVIHLIRELARGLGACHRAGILVCDVKPENVMVVGGPLMGLPPQGMAWTKIIDLGAALPLSEGSGLKGTDEGLWMGTPAYASPELIRGGALSPASDVYSLGVLLYELMTGQTPFIAATVKEQLRMHLLARPRPLSELRTDFPPKTPLECFLDSCLAKDPTERPGNMLAFLDQLDQALRRGGLQRSGREQAAMALPKEP